MKRLYVILMFVIMACDTQQDVQNAGNSSVVLAVVDSLGVDVGDSNYVLGKITDAMFDTDSTLVILDASNGTISKYFADDTISFISSRECYGSGPELIDNPIRFQLLDRDRIAVFSQGVPPEMLILDSQLNVITEKTTFESRGIIENPVVISDSILAGCTYDYEPDPNGGSIILRRVIGQWDTNSGECIGEYYSDDYKINIGEFDNAYDVKVAMECSMAADSKGNLYFAPSIYDSTVYIYNNECNAIDSIRVSLLHGVRSQFELNLEIECRKFEDGGLGDWSPHDKYLGVIQLQTQNEAQLIWIRHGSLLEPTYDVYTLGGTFRYRCTAEGLPNQDILQMNINDHGSVAYAPQPYDYPKLYILNMD